jgi:hypothetical protein
MLGLAQTQTLTPALQRLLPPRPASNHSSLATHHCLNQSLVFVVFFSITRAGGRPFRVTQHSPARRPRAHHLPLIAHRCLFLIATMNC